MENNRETFSADELSRCLSHYDLGEIRSTQEFTRGSRRAPKVVIEAARGKFLFKRRVHGRDDLAKVTFTHDIQHRLAQRSFPLPALIPTRDEGKTILLQDNNVYEMFEYVAGENYDGSKEATFAAGETLAMYHELLKEYQGQYLPPKGSYHSARSITLSICNTVGALPLKNRPPAGAVVASAGSLKDSYQACSQHAEMLGLSRWERQIVHGDWHPGNMLFRNRAIVAVVDYDAARLQQRVIDLANGALQFSIIGGSGEPKNWPDNVDEIRFASFIRGYSSISPLTAAEIEAIPYLMCEALIAEAVLPIAATGSFGRIEGFSFLQMIDRKVQWIRQHIRDLTSNVEYPE
ncbi:MAG: phosphotransferase [Phycisphaerae bacterium]|jgi:homoserine kinase type II